MGAYTSQIVVPESKACTKFTDPKSANWISVHAVATELNLAEVDRLWLRFKQLGCSDNGELTEEKLSKHPVYQDAFSRRIIMQFVNPKTKTITFENFLRGLKWCETSKPEDKLKGIFRMLNSGKDIPKDIFREIIKRVYVQPEDRGNIDSVVNTLYKMMDPKNKGTITEASFVKACRELPPSTLESALNFELLPSNMRQELHSKLPEFGNTPDPRSSTERAVPGDGALKRVADKVKSRDWDRLANKLNFDSEEINKFKSQHRDPEDQVYAMLRSWRAQEGSLAQASALARALRDCRMDDAVAVLLP